VTATVTATGVTVAGRWVGVRLAEKGAMRGRAGGMEGGGGRGGGGGGGGREIFESYLGSWIIRACRIF
jgi:hypothetical protein